MGYDYEKISERDPAAALDGTELIAGVQSGGDVRFTPEQIEDLIYRLGDTKISVNSYYKTSDRWLVWGCTKQSTTGDYSDLYSEVGDYWETARVAAGWAASGAGYFYPSPPAGYFPRPAYPDYEFDYTDVNVDDTINYTACPFRTGTPVLYEEGTDPITGLVDGTVYYIIADTDEFELASTEALAVAGTAVDITAVGTGTGHKLIFAHQLEEDAFQAFDRDCGVGHSNSAVNIYGAAGDGVGAGAATKMLQNLSTIPSVFAKNGDPYAKGNNGTPRPTNETRPAEIGLYYYTKAK